MTTGEVPKIASDTKRGRVEKDREKIRRFVADKGITRVAHFTPLENLASISRERGIYNRHEVDQWRAVGRRRGPFFVTDEYRQDGARWGICCSIEWPNFKMLSQKRRFLRQEFAIFLLDPALLWELSCVFIRTNAANSSIAPQIATMRKNVTKRSSQLMELYPNPDLRSPEYRPYPTDIQAEVLVDEQFIDLRTYGREVIFRCAEDQETTQQFRWPRQIRRQTDPGYFGHRPDGAH